MRKNGLTEVLGEGRRWQENSNHSIFTWVKLSEKKEHLKRILGVGYCVSPQMLLFPMAYDESVCGIYLWNSR